MNIYLYSVLGDEEEASYPESGPVIDSRDGGPEESISELLEGGVGLIGGNAAGKPLAQALWPGNGISKCGINSLQMGTGISTSGSNWG